MSGESRRALQHLDEFQTGQYFVAGEYRGEADEGVDQSAVAQCERRNRACYCHKNVNETGYRIKKRREEGLTCA